MLVIPGGAERTRAEFESLFSSAGLRIERIVPTGTPLCIIEGARADARAAAAAPVRS